MAAKKKTPTANRSTSGLAPKPEVDANAASTSVDAGTPTPPTELPVSPQASQGDVLKWVNRELAAGAQAVVTVYGATQISLVAKMPDGKHTQSLPPGDVLVVVLPPGRGRLPGAWLVTPSKT